MRRFARSLFVTLALAALGVASAARVRAAEPRCPLEISTCLAMYDRTRERPWFGIQFDRDSVGTIRVNDTVPGSPAARAGLKPGDVLESIEDRPPSEWFANKAGWKNGDSGTIRILRKGRERSVQLAYQHIPEEVFAKMVGAHMIEGHLAYMGEHDHAGEPTR